MPAAAQGIDPQSITKLDDARSVWVTASQKIRTLTSEAGPIESEYKSFFPRIDPLRQQIKQLVVNRERTLDDYRNGRWCSFCKATKSEMEAKGENFEAHIAKVGSNIVAPTKAQIDAKERELNAAIAVKQNQLDNLTARESRLRSRYSDILAAIQSLQQLWIRGLWQENFLYGELWRLDRLSISNQIAALTLTAVQSEAAIFAAKQKGVSADNLAGVQASHDAVTSQISLLHQELVDRFDVVTSKQKNFLVDKQVDQADLTRIVGALGSIGPGGWGWGSLSGDMIAQNFSGFTFIVPLLWLDVATQRKKDLADLLDGDSATNHPVLATPDKPAAPNVHDLLEGH